MTQPTKVYVHINQPFTPAVCGACKTRWNLNPENRDLMEGHIRTLHGNTLTCPVCNKTGQIDVDH